MGTKWPEVVVRNALTGQPLEVQCQISSLHFDLDLCTFNVPTLSGDLFASHRYIYFQS